MLVDRIADRLTRLISDIDSELDGEFIDLTVQQDHVHLFCTFPPTITPYQIIHRFKPCCERSETRIPCAQKQTAKYLDAFVLCKYSR